MQLRAKLKTILVCFVFVDSVSSLRVEPNEARMDMVELTPDKRTFLVGKFLLIPALAALGAKFMTLLPIFLAKIALLGIMNFISSNLNLLINVMLNFKKLFHRKSNSWPLQEEVISTQFEYPSLNPGLNLDWFNRRTNKYDKPKVIRIINENNGNSNNDKSKSYKSPYLDRLTRKAQPLDGNNNHLTYRHPNLSQTSGRYKCYWTESSDPIDNLLTKDFEPNTYSRKDYDLKDYTVKDYELKNYQTDYNIKDIELTTSEKSVRVLETDTESPAFDINQYTLNEIP